MKKENLKTKHVHKGDDGVQCIRVRRLRADLEELGASGRLAVEETVQDAGRDTHDQQQHEVDDDVEVRLLLDLRALRRGVAAVQHDLRVCARKHDQADDPRRVPDRAAAEQKLVDCHRLLLLLARRRVLVPKNAMVEVEVRVGWLGV